MIDHAISLGVHVNYSDFRYLSSLFTGSRCFLQIARRLPSLVSVCLHCYSVHRLKNQTQPNRSIVQGSGIAATLSIMFAHDLKPLDVCTYLLKYTLTILHYYRLIILLLLLKWK